MIDVNGMSIDDIMDMNWREINSLNENDLRQLSQRLNSAANKRLRRLEKSGEDKFSPAYKAIQESGGSFSVKGKTTKTDLRNEIQRASDFLRSKTGNVKGARQYKEKVAQMFPGREGEELSIDKIPEMQRKKLFRALDRLRESNASAVYNIGSDVIIRELRRTQNQDRRQGRDTLVRKLEERFPELLEDSEARYEREERERQERTDEDGVFRSLTPAESAENPFIRK